jgi:FAD-dependent urate hydroxylase
MDRRRRVPIVGGGIAGLALAPLLARAGDEVEVAEREPAWRPSGTGMYLPGNAARVLRAFGLEAQVASRAVAIAHQRFYDHHGRLLCEVDVADCGQPSGRASRCIGASCTRSSARRRVRCRSEWGWASSASLRATARSPSASATERAARRISWSGRTDPQRGAPAGVRADGGARPVGQIGWRFLAPRPREVTTWSVMLGRRTAFLTIPIAGECVYCYCDVVSPPDHDTPEQVGPERLGDLFSEFADPAATLLEELDAAADIHVSTIEEVVLDRWARERVVLIGDASHATSPNMAQGAAMALEEALVLTDCLQRIPAIPDAIAAFEARRRPRTDWVRAQTHRRDHTRYLPPTIRDNVLRFLGRRIFHANYRLLLDPP